MNELRKLPSVSAVLAAARNDIFADESDAYRVLIVREALDRVRKSVLSGSACPHLPAILEVVRHELAERDMVRVRRVINATGIALHTNLGRAPLPKAVVERVAELVTGYCNLEIDLVSGKRGKRAKGLRQMIKAIVGCEDSIIVNNGAASVFLALAGLAIGREVVISRGEMVQIGGGFRVPDILLASGANLCEVGTTNITTLADYERAIKPETALILRVHRSNFQLSGHTEEPALADLADLARSRGIPLVLDLGSGAFVRWRGHDPVREPTVQDAVRAGCSLVTFSADKLVGGPQAGFIVGEKMLVEKLERNPIYRTMRVGRMTVVTLQEVLRYYLIGRHAELAPWSMLVVDDETLASRGDQLLTRLSRVGISGLWVESTGTVGGGAAPGMSFSARLVGLSPKDPSGFCSRLRAHDPAVVPRIERGEILIDLRTVLAEELEPLTKALIACWQG